MRTTTKIGWLQQAVYLCEGSAASYKAAFMQATDPADERQLLNLCTARYALLERLLTELADMVGPVRLRALLAVTEREPSGRPPGLESALTTAMFCDYGLIQLLGPDLVNMADMSIRLATADNALAPDEVPGSVPLAPEVPPARRAGERPRSATST